MDLPLNDLVSYTRNSSHRCDRHFEECGLEDLVRLTDRTYHRTLSH